MAIATYTKSGGKATTTAKLSKDVFSLEVKDKSLLKTAYESVLAGARLGTSNVKNRSAVRGGGRKPWKQKGTGRARAGTIRSPLWRGGGVVFGPSMASNYTKKVSKTGKKAALKQALSLANTRGAVSVIEEFESKDGKTKDAVKLLVKIEANGKTVLVLETISDMTNRATRNIADLNITNADRLNVVDVLHADNIVFTKDALKKLEDRLAGVDK